MSTAKIRSTDRNAVVRPLRELYRLTQEQFALKLGVSLVTINRWENYRAKPTPLAIRQLKVLLIEISQSPIPSNRVAAHRLLAQYFCQD